MHFNLQFNRNVQTIKILHFYNNNTLCGTLYTYSAAMRGRFFPKRPSSSIESKEKQ